MLSRVWKFTLAWVAIVAIAPKYKDQGKFEFTGQIEQVAFALR